MTSKREQVLDAIKALVAAALPDADVKRNLAKADRIPPGGLVIVRDGDPGDPEVMLSPLLYIYTPPHPGRGRGIRNFKRDPRTGP